MIQLVFTADQIPQHHLKGKISVCTQLSSQHKTEKTAWPAISIIWKAFTQSAQTYCLPPSTETANLNYTHDLRKNRKHKAKAASLSLCVRRLISTDITSFLWSTLFPVHVGTFGTLLTQKDPGDLFHRKNMNQLFQRSRWARGSLPSWQVDYSLTRTVLLPHQMITTMKQQINWTCAQMTREISLITHRKLSHCRRWTTSIS